MRPLLPTWRLIVLALLLALTCPSYGQRIYGVDGGNKTYTRIAGKTKIPIELARQVKARDGYSPDDKHVVVGFLVPPELGGVPVFNNLSAFTKKEAKQRRELEKKIIKRVREGQMTVGEARSRIVYWKESQSAPDTKVKIRR